MWIRVEGGGGQTMWIRIFVCFIPFWGQFCPFFIAYLVVQGVWSFLPSQKISLCNRIQKKQSHELATLWNDPSPGLATQKKWQSPKLATPKLTRIGDCHFLGVARPELSHFRGWPVQDSRYFSGFWNIVTFGDGKKGQTPCIWPTSTQNRRKNTYTK